MKIRIDKDLSTFAWAVAVLFALSFGIFVGHSVTTANKNGEVADIQAALDTTRASLAEANEELAFWKGAMKGLADGNQLEGVRLK